MADLAAVHLGTFSPPYDISQYQINLSGYTEYTHLEIDMSIVGTSNAYYKIRFNANASNAYDYVRLTAPTRSDGNTEYFVGDVTMTNDVQQKSHNRLMLIEPYRTDVFKRWIDYGGAPEWNPRANMTGGMWRNTSAITELNITPSAGLLTSNTVVSIYGWVG